MKFAIAAAGIVGAAAAVSGEEVKATASVSKYPDEVADITPTGTLEVSYDGTVTRVAGNVTGLIADQCDTEETACGIHIHQGIQCTNVGQHFGQYGEGVDPWASTKFTATEGTAEIDVSVDDAGNSFVNTAGRTVAVHRQAGIQACGKILPVGLGKTIIAADLTPYPTLGDGQAKIGGDGKLFQLTLGASSEDDDTISITTDAVIDANLVFHDAADCSNAVATHALGEIAVTDGKISITASKATILGAAENEYADMYIRLGEDAKCSKLVTPSTLGGYIMASASEGKVKVEGSLLETAPNMAEEGDNFLGQGFHVHEGESCEASGGHLLLDDAEETDPYLGWSYTSDANGLATASKTTTVDVEFASIFNKPVVFHGPDGIRMACGVLSEITATEDPVTVGPTDEPTNAASTAVYSAFAYGPVLYAAYNAL